MAHTRAWVNSTPANGDNVSAGAGEIRNVRTDVDERMTLEHSWGDSTTYDGVHLVGDCAVVDSASAAATIIGGSYKTGSYNGSVAMANDTDVLYVKKGTANATDGTWTVIATSSTFLSSSSGTDTTPYGTFALNGGSTAMGTDWTNLDLSSIVGSQKTLVFLKIVNNTSGDRGGHFRPDDSTEDVGDTASYADSGGCTTWRVSAGESAFVVVSTDSTGVIEYKCSTASSDIDVFVMNYVK